MDFDFTTFPNLESQRLKYRELGFDDTEAIFNLRSNKIINALITRKIPDNLEDAKDFISVCLQEFKKGNRIFWAMELDEKVIGTIVYHRISFENKYAEIGYELDPNFHQKGLMSEAMKTVLGFGFNKMKLKTTEAFTHKNNTASKALLKKHNFVFQPERKDIGFDHNRIWKLEKS